MTSRRPYWCPKQRNGGHVGVPNQSCGSWTLFLCKRFLLHRCWPREWKHSIIRYSMNNNGIKLEQVVHTHRPELLADKVCFSKSQSSLLNINFRVGRFQSSILLIREFKIPRRRRPRKRRLKSEFAFFQSHCDFSNSLTLSNASELFLSRIPKNHIQVQKKKGNLAVACLRPPSNVKLGIFLS